MSAAHQPFIGPQTAAAFSAIEQIMNGEWDRYLIRISSAVRQRMATSEWTTHIIAGGRPLVPAQSEPVHDQVQGQVANNGGQQ